MVKIVTIGDIHIGAGDTNMLKQQLDNEFFAFLKDFKPDLLVNLGDISDHKLMMNSEEAELFIDLGYRMRESAPNVLIVNGTLSHEMYQNRLYKNLLSENYRLIYKAERVFMCGLDLLILPEEYDLPNNYYDNLLKNKYDFAFGHGMFSHVGNYARNIGSLHSNKHAKVWDWKEFTDNIYAHVVFGHIHVGSEYKNIIYPSSFSRDSFGEEEPKGFYIFEYDEISKKVIKKEFIQNKLAPTYKDILVSKLPLDNIDHLFKVLKRESDNNFKIRLIIDQVLEEGIMNNILAFVRASKNATMLKKVQKQSTQKEQEEKEKVERINSEIQKYKNKDFYEITKLYAKEHFNHDFTNEEINELLNTK